jgi:hypothetical protein
MPVTLERLVKVIEDIDTINESDCANQWLGAFKGVIPKEMQSTEYIKMLRESCYGKI